MFSRYIFTCLVCNSLQSADLGLCHHCKQKVLESFSPGELRLEKNLSVKFFFDWSPDKNHHLGYYLGGLKGGLRRQVFKELAAIIKTEHSVRPHSVVVPIPGSGVGRNHALRLAENLGGRLKVALRKKGLKTQQKELSRHLRARVEFTPIEKISCDSDIVLVDDVITTGHTLLAAWRALGSPPRTEAVVLAYRALLPENQASGIQ